MLIDDFTSLSIFEELRFIYELLIAELLFVIPSCKKRKYFLIRFIPSTILMGIISQFYIVLVFILKTYASIDSKLFNAIIVAWYVILTLLSVGYLLFNFDFKIDQAILHTISGYSLQHIEYAIINQFVALTLWQDLRDTMVLYVAISITSYALICICAYYLFVKKYNSLDNIILSNKKSTLFLYLLILVFLVFLTFSGQSIYRQPGVTNPNYLGLAVEVSICTIVNMTLYLLYSTNQERLEKELVSKLLKEDTYHYELTKESIEIINKKCHDIKHSLRAMKTIPYEERDGIISKLEEEIMIYDMSIKTKNKILDIILMEKQLYSVKNKIKINYLGDASSLNYLSTSDLYSLFGNAIDNAIEAVLKIEEKKRIIDISIENKGLVIIVNISNYYNGEIKENNGVISTSKSDKNYHGIGISSMKEILKKYEGEFKISISNDVFTTTFVLPTK